MNKSELFEELTNIKKLYTKYYVDDFKNVSEFVIKRINDHFMICYKRHEYAEFVRAVNDTTIYDVVELLDKNNLSNTDGDFLVLNYPFEIDEEYDNYENANNEHAVFHLSIPYL